MSKEKRHLDLNEVQKAEDTRNSIRNRLARLTRRPDKISLQAMELEDGSVTTAADEMAEQLKAHWSRVFGEEDPDLDAVRDWFAWARQQHVPTSSCPAGAWRVRRRDVVRALRLAGNSRPGPDGIPFEAWRRLEQLGVNILFAVAQQLERGLDSTRSTHLKFNESLMACLPKTASRQDASGRGIYKPDETRPLTITNCDNRIVASAFRWRWEPLLAPTITRQQRGFIRGRSMIRNIVEIEHEAMIAAIEEQDAALILFDFRAAFPSLGREYLFHSLEAFGFPPSAMCVVRSLYLNTTAHLMLMGQTHGAIMMAKGIRQGCPLSPLLFAIATHSFLHLVNVRHNRSTVRAFADDTAMIIRSWRRDGRKVFRTFHGFGRVSQMRLNLVKTVGIPLWPEDPELVRDRLAASPADPHITWADAGKYLGVFIGPGKGHRSWAKPLAKFRERLGDWP